MANDSFTAQKYASLILTLAGLSIATLYIFRAELAESIVDSISSNSTAIHRTVADKDLPEAPKMVLRPSQNDIDLVKVSDLKAGPATAAGNSIAFTLANEGDNNSFPSLKIILINRFGRQQREIVYAPGEYAHPEKFEQNEIRMMIPLQPGETGFTVKPFYKAAP